MSGNTVLITGGASGIGYSLAKHYIERDNKVLICGRTEEKLVEAKEEHPEIEYKVCDVADEGDRRSLYRWVEDDFEDMNVLVNNAGVQRNIDLTAGVKDLKKGDDEIEINLKAPIYLSSQFIPFLEENEDPAIINVSSGLAFSPAPGVPVYCATKAGLHSYTVSLREQLSESEIEVYEVIPPLILDTELNEEGRSERGLYEMDIKAPTSDEFVEAVMKGLENDEYEIGYGTTEEIPER
ncbi:MAG: SDR family oxidoreductase [Candidatus Natronoplasma sp.]